MNINVTFFFLTFFFIGLILQNMLKTYLYIAKYIYIFNLKIRLKLRLIHKMIILLEKRNSSIMNKRMWNIIALELEYMIKI
jgi:hypothetical protein